jgi:tRNA (cytidine/uridine-2'-O-)-methyltransferase
MDPRMHVVLYQPEIPPNTGNVIRLCANTGTRLHLIRPLGFELDDRRLRRAGLDYHEFATVSVHDSLDGCMAEARPNMVYAFSTRARRRYSEVEYHADDMLLFGPETRGLPASILEALPETQRLRIPMRPGSRSLNLANSVAVTVFEAWRQQGFSDGG